MALPEFPQVINRDDIQQTPHGDDGNNDQDDTYGYENPQDPRRGMAQTHRRNAALMDPQATPITTGAETRTVIYREQL